MELTSIRQLYRDRGAVDHDHVTVGGWVRSIRASKAFGFIMLADGTFFEPIQIVYDEKLPNFAEISKYNVGSALVVEGRIIETPDAKQPFEIHADSVTLEAAPSPTSDPEPTCSRQCSASVPWRLMPSTSSSRTETSCT